jgi:hypothetical protein
MVMAIKVSQSTIDKIKGMGMTAALKKAPNASPEMTEALKRMYGAKRVAAAGGKKATTPKATSPDMARGAVKKASTTSTAGAGRSSKGMANSAPSRKTSTTSNPLTALHNKVSPYGNKSQKYVSGLPKVGLAGRKSVPGKPSIGEQISGAFSGKGIGNKATASSVASTMAKRMGISVAEYNKQLAAAKAKKAK